MVVGWWSRPSLGLSFSQAEQNNTSMRQDTCFAHLDKMNEWYKPDIPGPAIIDYEGHTVGK